MDDASAPLQDYLRAGIVAADLPDLHPLLSARDLLRAFSTLFHGGEESVMVRLLVLRAIGERGAAPDWSPQELRDHFAYLDPVKFDTVLGRLRENDLLRWDNDTQRYRISPVGRQALSSIGLLLQFNREGDELAYVTAQLAAGQAVGRVRGDDLQHLLSRLNEYREDFDQAVLSGSEHRIQRAAGTLQQVWQWVEKGTAIVKEIAADEELDAATHRVAQQIGRAQSSMLRQASVFQRALNQLDRHRVHIGASGLSSTDVNRFLRGMDTDALAALADDALARVVAPAFMLAPIALDIAEYELVEREREAQEDASLPPAQDAPDDTQAPVAENDYAHAEQWLSQLTSLERDADTALSDWVPQDGFAVSAYRLSLLGLIGDPGAENRNGVSASIAQLPLRWKVGTQFEQVNRAGVAYMSRAWLTGKDDAAYEADSVNHGDDECDAGSEADTHAAPKPSRKPSSRRKPGPRPVASDDAVPASDAASLDPGLRRDDGASEATAKQPKRKKKSAATTETP
ncbi:hypothetical protein [Lysobacter changpingensis]|uniref:hypothetical protein n=1 Tax=Lysobacter changpingensis TaxID=2792784 RepID=UPI001A8DA2D9|nr:hypothetical protein [Lysobacter changpingensis]